MRSSIDIGTVVALQTIMYQVTSPSQCSQMKFVAYGDKQNVFFYGAYRKQVANSSSVMEGSSLNGNLIVLNIGNMKPSLKKKVIFFL
jgi:hypothetical protein